MYKIFSLPNVAQFVLKIFLLSLAHASFGQVPQGVSYQAVLRGSDGTLMTNSDVSLTFRIHDQTALGQVVYQETHQVSTNSQGLVNCIVGNGNAEQGVFSNIDWSIGSKYLQVLVNNTDIGTQQMMSVPYALQSKRSELAVEAENGFSGISPVGDTLFFSNGNFIIIPGISGANPVSLSGLGSELLPGNTTCLDEYISVSSCGNQSQLSYDGRIYDLVEIGGQCWFEENLATDQYLNGDLINTGLSAVDWANSSFGSFAIYNDDITNDSLYGKLYNWYAVNDERGLCPAGWHVPTNCEWMYLENHMGMSVSDQMLIGHKGVDEGNKLKSISGWSINTGNNSSGFQALPGGYRYVNGSYVWIGTWGMWWSSTPWSSTYSVYYRLGADEPRVGYFNANNEHGFSVRCIKN